MKTPALIKRALLLIILAGTILAVVGPGKRLTLAELSSLLAEGGVQVEGYELEGWSVLESSGELTAVWEKTGLEEALGIADARIETVPTSWGDRLQVTSSKDGVAVRAAVQRIAGTGGRDLCCILVRCTLPGETPGIPDWERKMKRAFSSLGEEGGISMTVRGKIPVPLDDEAQLAWGRAVFRELRSPVTGILREGNYLSLTGYSSLLPDAVKVSGEKININLALVGSENERETRVYLGTPLISCEY